MANGVCTGGARVGDDVNGAVEPEGVRQIEGLPLRLIMHGPRDLIPLHARLADGLAVISFTQTHPAAGRSQHEG